MERRKAIHTITVAAAATFFLPACSGKKAVGQLVAGKLKLDGNYLTYLAKISQSILPVHGISDRIPNAVTYIMTMLNDCRPQEDIIAFAKGFDQFMEYIKGARNNLVRAESEEIAQRIADMYAEHDPPGEMARFLGLVKELSIANLYTSEYYQSEYKGYLLVPETYVACVKLNENG